MFTERRKASSICVSQRRERQRHTLTAGEDRFSKSSRATRTRSRAHARAGTHVHIHTDTQTQSKPPKQLQPLVTSHMTFNIHKISHFQKKTEGGSRTVCSGKWRSLSLWAFRFGCTVGWNLSNHTIKQFLFFFLFQPHIFPMCIKMNKSFIFCSRLYVSPLFSLVQCAWCPPHSCPHWSTLSSDHHSSVTASLANHLPAQCQLTP